MNEYTIDDVQRDYDAWLEDEEVNEAHSKDFVIDNDTKAEWAIRKIKEAQDEHDRISALIDAEEERLKERKEKNDKKLESDTSYLKYLLNSYMNTVKCKETKTQRTYQLLSGKLVYKYGGTEWIKDEDKLLAWAKADDPALVKVKESVDWVSLKKRLTVTDKGDVITEDGELLDFIRAEKKPDSLDIKFTE